MKKSAVELLEILNSCRLRVFTTSDMMTLTGMAASSVAQALHRLEKRKLLTKVKRGVWVHRGMNDLNPFEVVPFLRAPWPSYVSLYSALADYGLIEEIPHIVYAVTSASPKSYRTAVGDFQFHHLPKRLVWGYQVKYFRQASYFIAEPEKAFLDLVYLSLIPRSPVGMVHKRGGRWKFDFRKLGRYAHRFNYPPLISCLRKKLKIPILP